MVEVAGLLRAQWHSLRMWLDRARVLDHGAKPSGLGGWTVRDLVVHLGYGLHMVTEVAPATGRQPVTLAAYIAGYAPAQQQIATETMAAAASVRGDELGEIDRLADAVWRRLADGLPPVVLGRRGPLRKEDFLLTRLIELVTHGDDLHRVVGTGADTPLAAAAVDRVALALTAAYAQVAGRPPELAGLELIRAATGREPCDDPALPLLS